MKKLPFIVGVLALVIIAFYVIQPDDKAASQSLRVAISPYQDLAMLTAHEHLGLEAKYKIDLEVVTLAWENVIPSLASAGHTVDIGFGSLIEFLTKYENINSDATDPLVYVYPAYVFKGGGFISFNSDVPNLDDELPPKAGRLRDFFSYRIGAQKNSMYDMMLFSLLKDAGLNLNQAKIIDTTMGDGILAAQAGSLDAAAAGLTQRNEALERGGRVVVTMDKHGFADLTGIICKKSTLDKRREDIEKFIRIWFESVDYVYKDIDKNSRIPLEYLSRASSTQYTVETYKRALEAEYLPRSVGEAKQMMISNEGDFSIGRISNNVIGYLVSQNIVKNAPPIPVPIAMEP
uniref:ABC-type nitrate/sulfonate/bicarbonate transport system, substrate-binding protein n=1 Tax=Candidatus Kentrum sp. DK TaxID=2126562 RepID=A0A450SFH6_9GAMM|nr:MAG: ABC-type nitrate/sulfonate/bicarbonate transport system, substrate-binding protein [Candidatus Kentron sp. DK]